ncbi:hypothetical protein [Streptomyces sp. gb1(2016)]|uniref:hypothetical protein n=1 Tax=Streptomyces sp. gb1(2016) TaxID=1828321 RepID=UPI0011CDD9D7|nr:hypothetical protein [Streptomyces sp. gb1(2016)]
MITWTGAWSRSIASVVVLCAVTHEPRSKPNAADWARASPVPVRNWSTSAAYCRPRQSLLAPPWSTKTRCWKCALSTVWTARTFWQHKIRTMGSQIAYEAKLSEPDTLQQAQLVVRLANRQSWKSERGG